jgi:heme-degrading monooxygenase HmoA
MAGMFMTITRCHVKASNEKEARKILQDQLLPNDGKKPGSVVPGLIGFGLMKAKKDPTMYGVVTVWRSEADFDKLASHPMAKKGPDFVSKFKALCDGKVQGEGFYIESL